MLIQALSFPLSSTPVPLSPLGCGRLSSSSSSSSSSSHPPLRYPPSVWGGRDEMNPIITGSGAGESGKRNKREAARAKNRAAVGERRSRKQPVSLKQGLTLSGVSTNEILYFVICMGFKFVNDPATNFLFLCYCFGFVWGRGVIHMTLVL